LSVWVREAVTVFGFPMILAYHTIGMGFVAGLSSAMDLRILGVARQVPFLELKRFLPVMWAGFWLNAVSGVLLLIAYPTKALTNPVFYLKLSLIALAMWAFIGIARRSFHDPVREDGATSPIVKLFAVASLACWAGAITSGRSSTGYARPL